MITLINDKSENRGGSFEMIFTDPPFDMGAGKLHKILSNYQFEHLVLIASMRQVLELYPKLDMDFCFDLVANRSKPKESRSYAMPHYLHNNIFYFKKHGVKSAFDRRLVARADQYSDTKTHYYPTFFDAPKRDIVYRYQKNQQMIDDIIGAFNVSTVCDMFAGSGTTGLACVKHEKDCTLIEAETEPFNIMKQQLDFLQVKYEVL
ncbi:DNA methyltransferase [Dichelobacter nodosus]|nr:DNA methyltransferase [Dichelobacter nodosus]KNZ40121.1 hypothetical protein AKG33_00140 [Dichelobacter nodosus]